MTLVMHPSLAQAIAYVQQLSPLDQMRLIAHIATHLAPSPLPLPSSWEAWDDLRTDISANFPDAQIAQRLETDRQEREQSLTARNH